MQNDAAEEIYERTPSGSNPIWFKKMPIGVFWMPKLSTVFITLFFRLRRRKEACTKITTRDNDVLIGNKLSSMMQNLMSLPTLIQGMT